MKKVSKLILTLTIILASMTATAENPFYKPFSNAEHGTAPFSQFNDTMWMPAIDRGIELAKQEIAAIKKQRSTPDFENTIIALERSGRI